VIEHNLDVIKTSDRIINLGPEGGEEEGLVVAQGIPEQVAAAAERSHTGRFLTQVVEPAAPRKRRGARAKGPRPPEGSTRRFRGAPSAPAQLARRPRLVTGLRTGAFAEQPLQDGRRLALRCRRPAGRAPRSRSTGSDARRASLPPPDRQPAFSRPRGRLAPVPRARSHPTARARAGGPVRRLRRGPSVWCCVLRLAGVAAAAGQRQGGQRRGDRQWRPEPRAHFKESR
jgi:hypothetical protein